MNRLLVSAAPDGSVLTLGEEVVDPHRMLFRHGGGEPIPVWGTLPGFWIEVGGRAHIVFAGDTLDEPEVDRVRLELPHDLQDCRARRTKHRSVWMSFPIAFGEGAELEPGDVVTATFFAGDRVVDTAKTDPLEWGEPVPPPPVPPGAPEWPDIGSPKDEPEKWTGYAPGA